MTDLNALEHKLDRGVLARFSKKEAKPDQHLQQQSDSVDPHTNDAPAYNGQAHDAPPPTVSRQPQYYGRNSYAGDFGMFGKEVVKPDQYVQQQSHTVNTQTTDVPAYTGKGQYKDFGQGVGGNSYAGEFGMFGKEVAKPDQYVQQQSYTVVPHASHAAAYTGDGQNADNPAVFHHPQNYDQGARGNTGAGNFGMIGKELEAKSDEQFHTGDPHAMDAPAYSEENEYAPPPAVSEEPHDYTQGAGENTYARELGMFFKENAEQDKNMQQQFQTVDPLASSYNGEGIYAPPSQSIYGHEQRLGNAATAPPSSFRAVRTKGAERREEEEAIEREDNGEASWE